MFQDVAQSPTAAAARVLQAAALTGLAWGLTVATAPLLFVQLGLSEWEVGLLGGAQGLGLLLGARPAPRLLARLGTRPLLAGGLALYGVELATFPHMEAFAALFALRVLDGVLSMAVTVANETRMLAAGQPGAEASSLGRLNLVLSAGFLGGAVASAIAITACAPWVLFAAAGLAMLVGAALAARVPDAPARPVAEAAVPATGAAGASWRLPLAVGAAFGAFVGTLQTVLPVHFVREVHLPEASVAAMPAVFLACLVGALRPLSRLADRLGPRRVLAALAFGALPVCAALVLAPGTLGLYLAAGFAGAILGPTQSIGSAWLGQRARPGRLAGALATFGAAIALGRVLGPPVAGRVYEGLGAEAMFGVLGAMWLGLGLALLRAERR